MPYDGDDPPRKATIRKIVPRALRSAASTKSNKAHAERLEAAAKECEMEGTKDAAIAAYEAALNEAGLVVVPREPTEEMMRAAIEADEPEYSGGSLEGAIFNRLRTEYCAMLAAASPAPKDTKEEE